MLIVVDVEWWLWGYLFLILFLGIFDIFYSIKFKKLNFLSERLKRSSVKGYLKVIFIE